MPRTSAVTEPLIGSDLVLLLLAAPTRVNNASGRIDGITRLEKPLFLVDRETTVAKEVATDQLHFKAYNYGPFSKEVYEAVDLLEDSRLVREERKVDGRTIDNLEDLEVVGTTEADDYVTRCFVLTDAGRLVADYLAAQHQQVLPALTHIKDAYAHLSLNELIRYVYRTYPDTTVKSKIRDRYL